MNRITISLVLMLFIACGSEQTGPVKTTIAVIPKGTTHEFWKSIHAGAVKAQTRIRHRNNMERPAQRRRPRRPDRAGRKLHLSRRLGHCARAPRRHRPSRARRQCHTQRHPGRHYRLGGFKARTSSPLSPPTIIAADTSQVPTWPSV